MLVQTDKHSIKILLRRKNLRFLRRTNLIKTRYPLNPAIMKKLFLLIFVITSNSYCQSVADVFKMEFIKTMVNINNESNEYFTDLVDRNLYSKKDSLTYGFFNNKDEIVIKANYTYASDFFNGKSNIIKDSISGILFKDNTKKMFPEYDATFWHKSDLGLVIKDNKYGFINTKGKIIIALDYEDAFPFFNGYASVKKNGKWNYINEKGKLLFKDYIICDYRPIIDNKAVFMKDSIKVEKTKIIMSENGSRTFVEFLNNIEKIQFKEGLIGINGEIIIDPIYDEISGYFQDGFMRVRNDGKTGIIDEKGKLIIPVEYDDISDLKNGLLLAQKENQWGMIDLQNQIIIPFDYDKIRYFNNDLALVNKKNKIGYINIKNEMVIAFQYDYNLFGDFNNGLALVKKDGKFGFINKKNEIIIPLIYENALPFKDKNTIVKKDGKTFFINQKGEKIKQINKQYLWLEKDEMTRFAE